MNNLDFQDFLDSENNIILDDIILGEIKSHQIYKPKYHFKYLNRITKTYVVNTYYDLILFLNSPVKYLFSNIDEAEEMRIYHSMFGIPIMSHFNGNSYIHDILRYLINFNSMLGDIDISRVIIFISPKLVLYFDLKNSYLYESNDDNIEITINVLLCEEYINNSIPASFLLEKMTYIT